MLGQGRKNICSFIFGLESPGWRLGPRDDHAIVITEHSNTRGSRGAVGNG
jgi:hypothetical protein